MPFAKLSYFFDFALCPILMAFFACRALSGSDRLSILEASFWSLAGAAMWTFIEYWVHRLLFHHAPLLRKMHATHHRHPDALVGAPPAVLPLALIVLAYGMFQSLGQSTYDAVLVGLLGGYTFYSFMHFAAHHVRSRRLSYLVHLKHRHMLHHFGPDDMNFGVTTIFWDRVFGTARTTPRREMVSRSGT